MANLTTQTVPVSGYSPTYTAASAGGDEATTGPKVVAHVRNGSASSVTVTVATPGTVQGLSIADATLAIPAGGDGFVQLNTVYRNATTGRAAITYSATTSVDVAVLQLP